MTEHETSHRVPWLIASAVIGTGLVAAIAYAGYDSGTQSATSATATVVASTPVTSAPTASGNSDAVVCASLEKVGRAFYQNTYVTLMANDRATVEPIKLAAELGALSTVGASDGSINGAAAIAAASPALREKLITVTRDADRIAQRYVDVSRGAATGSDITPIVNSFTDALIACSHAGHQPSWFDPAALVTR